MPGPTQWFVEFDANGAFILKGNQTDGNFRIQFGDSVEMRGYASTPHPAIEYLYIEDPLDQGSSILGSVDPAYQNWCATWKPSLPGAYKLHLIFHTHTATHANPHLAHTNKLQSQQSHHMQLVQHTQPQETDEPYFYSNLVRMNSRKTSFDNFVQRSNSNITFDHEATDSTSTHIGSCNYVIVEPQICICNQIIQKEAICMQTILSHSLGKFSNWKQALKLSGYTNYNVIHFTPLQTTGASGSCYSIANQNEVSSYFVDTPPTTAASGGATNTTAIAHLQDIIQWLEKDMKILATTDIVLNHTAHNSPWLTKHPESGYNMENSPHLRGALELDLKLEQFSSNIVDGHYREKYGVTEHIHNEEDIKRIIHALKEEVIIPFRFSEWFQIDIKKSIEHFLEEAEAERYSPCSANEACDQIKAEVLRQVGIARNVPIVVSASITQSVCADEAQLLRFLNILQADLYHFSKSIESSIAAAVDGSLRWERLVLRKGPITKNPWQRLVQRYFTPLVDDKGNVHHLANNGWVFDWDASKDLAAPGTLVYFKRELVVWSDCVKLRYGKRRSEAPFLWDWMADYCRSTARLFGGIRLDNCHSTPIHVAKYMLKEARAVHPHIWIYAELFTGRREMDFYYEKELGINALIREAMQTRSARDLGNHLLKYGGIPVGALQPIEAAVCRQSTLQPLVPSLCPALFFDCTHDNEPPAVKQTPSNALPLAAVVAASVCASGSTRGFDELIPYTLSVVSERRLFCNQSDYDLKASKESKMQQETDEIVLCLTWKGKGNSVATRGNWDNWRHPITCENVATDTFQAKVHLDAHFVSNHNDLLFKFIVDGAWQTSPEFPVAYDRDGHCNNIYSLKPHASKTQGKDANIIRMKRILNDLHFQMGMEGYTEVYLHQATEDLMVVQRHNPQTNKCIFFIIRCAFSWSYDEYRLPKIEIPGKIQKTHLAARLWVPQEELKYFHSDQKYINGLNGQLFYHHSVYDIADVHEEDKNTVITLKSFLPGSVVVIETMGYSDLKDQIANYIEGLPPLFDSVSLVSLSYLLFNCDREELDHSFGARSTYFIPEYGSLVYAGICGVIPLLDEIRMNHNLGHPLCKNLREGLWLLDYWVKRLEAKQDLKCLQSYLEPIVLLLDQSLPRWLIPSYFDWLISAVFSICRWKALKSMSPFIAASKDPLVQRLALSTLQFYAYVPSAPLIGNTTKPSLCAGLPHFSSGFMRNWGRDTFIAITGILIVTGRYDEAKEEILGYARVLRHSLIPNLLDSGNNPRYNARDAVWYFLQSIQDYCKWAPDGCSILQSLVEFVFPADSKKTALTLADVVHQILQSHATGIAFRERNAGIQLDEHMLDEGFNISIEFDSATGMIYSNNRYNCGTWMDKMGSSVKAGNKGIPATPRTGAAIEIIGLLYSALNFFASLPISVFPHKRIVLPNNFEISYSDWMLRMEDSFERLFFVSDNLDMPVIKRQYIYKDLHLGFPPEADYQLRPNVCVAMSYAPKLFTAENANRCLKTVESELWGEDQLGLKTLDPQDEHYCGDYDNANDSYDKNVAHGYNYHQGPEWLWPLGHFLKAKAMMLSNGATPIPPHIVKHCMAFLHNHRLYLSENVWMSLPELTNSNGRECPFSCKAQAWTIGTLLLFLHYLYEHSTAAPLLPSQKNAL